MLENRFKDKGKDDERKAKKIERVRLKTRIAAVLLPIVLKLLAILVIISVAATLMAGFLKIINGQVFEWAATSTAKLEEQKVINTEDRCLDLSNDVIDELIQQLIDNGLDVAKLKMLGDETDLSDKTEKEITEAMRKYIREYYAAELITQYPDMSVHPGERTGFLGLVDKGTETISKIMGQYQGCIRLIQPDANGNVTLDENGRVTNTYLTYISEEEFENLCNAGNEKVEEHFTVSGNNIKVAGWTITTVEGDSGENSSTKSYYTTTLNFKAIASAYTMPMEFLLMVNLYSENPEFTYALAKMVENSQIVLAVQHNYSETVQDVITETEYYIDPSIEYETDEEGNILYDAKGKPIVKRYIEGHWSGEIVTTQEITTTKSWTPAAQLVLADTWIVKKQVGYKKNNIPAQVGEPVEEEFDNPQDSRGKITTTTTTQSYSFVEDTGKTTEEEKTKLVLGLLRNAQGTYDEKNLLEFEPEKRSQMKYVRYKIPNTIVERSPSGNLVSGAKMMIDDLEKNESTQNQAEIMKYLMYVYTGIDQYGGATEFDQLKDLFVTKTFVQVSGGYNKLKEVLHSFEGAPPEDGNGNYIIFDDNYGNLTVGYGVTIKYYGERLNAQGFADLSEGALIEKSIVDTIENQIIDQKRKTVESQVAGLNLTPYQIDALIVRCYNYNVSGFKSAYTMYWNEGDDMLGEPESAKVYNHSLYEKYMNKPVTSNGEYAPGLEKRRKAEWLLFRTGHYTGLNGEDFGYWTDNSEFIEKILMKAYEISDYMRHNGYHYSLDTNLLKSSFTASMVGSKAVCCATYVSWVLQEAGYAMPCHHSSPNLYDYLNDTFIPITSYNELEAGDIVFMNTTEDPTRIYSHVQIYAGNGTWYNAGGNDSIQKLPYPYSDNMSEEFTIGLRPTK